MERARPGRVYDAASGLPVEDFTLEATPYQRLGARPGWHREVLQLAGTGGRLDVAGLDPGYWELRVSARVEGQRRSWTAPTELLPAGTRVLDVGLE